MSFIQFIVFSASAFAEELIEGQAFSDVNSPMMGMNGYNGEIMINNPAMMNAMMNNPAMMNSGMMNDPAMMNAMMNNRMMNNPAMMGGVSGPGNFGMMNNSAAMNALSIPPMSPMSGGSNSSANSNGGSHRSSSGSHNEGSTYSNQSAWDRGYNNTDSNTFSIGQYDNEDSDMFNQFGSNNNRMMGYGRRLDASGTSVLDSLFEIGVMATLSPEDEPIDGQAFRSRRNSVLNQYPVSNDRMESQLLRGNPTVNAGYATPSLVRSVISPIFGNSGVANTGSSQSMSSDLTSNGMYNSGATYANSSGWDRGYNNTEAQSFSNGRSVVSSRDAANRTAARGTTGSFLGNVLGGLLGPIV